MNIEIRGVQETIRRLRQFGQAGEQRIKQITAVAAQEIASKAAANLSSYSGVDDDGKIGQSINASAVGDGLAWGISVNLVPIAAYIEFGTGTFVDIPAGWEDIAMAFYVNGKGYTTPHPYLYPAFFAVSRTYSSDLRTELNRLAYRFNSGR